MEKDLSVFESIKEDIYNILPTLPFEGVKEYTLYISDKKTIETIVGLGKALDIEYGYDEHLLRRTSLSNIVKVINVNHCAYRYNISFQNTSKRIVDPKKVFSHLDAELAKEKNRLKKEFKTKIAFSETEQDRSKIEEQLKSAINQAERRYQDIKSNFDYYDVRISNHHVSNGAYYVNYAIIDEDGNKQTKTISSILRKSVPNILWFEKSNRKARDNEFQLFLKKATRAYGDVYYKKKDD